MLNVIKEAKQYDCHRHIENLNNWMKTIWNITKSETEKMFKNEDIYIYIYIYIYPLNITWNTTYDCYFRLFQQSFLNNSWKNQ